MNIIDRYNILMIFINAVEIYAENVSEISK